MRRLPVVIRERDVEYQVNISDINIAILNGIKLTVTVAVNSDGESVSDTGCDSNNVSGSKQ